ncbi:collagen alpha-1(I) chain-like [Canis lupus familiaris]|uniref:collagen alpha-1(I) chain-like n=1 Tax=Canis lupus familiaris TaxID=9615 RepID=UPI0018F3C75B|nr:collagen alpha-1(I) chain-like [Canis lupus familiaris]
MPPATWSSSSSSAPAGRAGGLPGDGGRPSRGTRLGSHVGGGPGPCAAAGHLGSPVLSGEAEGSGGRAGAGRHSPAVGSGGRAEPREVESESESESGPAQLQPPRRAPPSWPGSIGRFPSCQTGAPRSYWAILRPGGRAEGGRTGPGPRAAAAAGSGRPAAPEARRARPANGRGARRHGGPRARGQPGTERMEMRLFKCSAKMAPFLLLNQWAWLRVDPAKKTARAMPVGRHLSLANVIKGSSKLSQFI